MYNSFVYGHTEQNGETPLDIILSSSECGDSAKNTRYKTRTFISGTIHHLRLFSHTGGNKCN